MRILQVIYLHIVSIATACTEAEQVVSLDVFMYSMCYTVLKVCKCVRNTNSWQVLSIISEGRLPIPCTVSC